MAKKTTEDINLILNDIEARRFAPVYFLHGEEGYFIDRIADSLLSNVLTEEEKDFNLVQYYGVDVTIPEVISACRRYPMIGDYNLVVLREAQNMRQAASQLDSLEVYLRSPMQQTVLVVTHKEKSFDARRKLLKQIKDVGGVVYESCRMRDYELPHLFPSFATQKGFEGVTPEAVDILCNYVGCDVARMSTELDKLHLSIGNKRITSEAVLEYIGVSKEYNNFELVSAIANGNYLKAETIRQYFERNPRNNPLVLTLAALFGYYTSLMLAHYATDKSEKGLMSELHISFPAAKDVKAGMRRYNAWKVMNSISMIRDCDAQAKGARDSILSDSELLRELLFKLMH